MWPLSSNVGGGGGYGLSCMPGHKCSPAKVLSLYRRSGFRIRPSGKTGSGSNHDVKPDPEPTLEKTTKTWIFTLTKKY